MRTGHAKRWAISILWVLLTIYLAGTAIFGVLIGSTDNSGSFRVSGTDRLMSAIFFILALFTARAAYRSFKKLKE